MIGPISGQRHRPARVLIVEDSANDTRLIQEALRAGAVPTTVEVAGDAEEALRLLRDAHHHGRPPDVVVLDLHLPGRSGFDLLTDIRADPSLRRVPVVVLSSSAAFKDVTRSYDLRANSYVVKPLDPDEFVSAVQAVQTFWLGTAMPPSAADD